MERPLEATGPTGETAIPGEPCFGPPSLDPDAVIFDTRTLPLLAGILLAVPRRVSMGPPIAARDGDEVQIMNQDPLFRMLSGAEAAVSPPPP